MCEIRERKGNRVCLLLWGFGKARDPPQSAGPSGLNLLAIAHRGLPAPGYQKYWPIRAGDACNSSVFTQNPGLWQIPKNKGTPRKSILQSEIDKQAGKLVSWFHEDDD